MNQESLRICGLAILLAPLGAAALCGALGSRVLRGATHWITLAGIGSALAAAVYVLRSFMAAPADQAAVRIPLFEWVFTGAAARVMVELWIDQLTAIMLTVVTGVAFLVVMYSREYMRDHGHPVRGYERFFAYLALFVFAMCTLVLGGNFLMLYFGWEAVGLCSYLLIGFYYEKPSAAAAAKKAFLVNRVGDFGFGLGIFLIYWNFNTLEYAAVFKMVQDGVTVTGAPLSGCVITTIALLLLCGACGKSAQLPLHVWLPDAMEGPSPVSALIHAATMVTAGIYMIARCGAIFTESEVAMSVVATVGATTALFAATIAIVQTDMKRILAYSTISQLGYMVLAAGVYAADSAVFHLFTHAFFKALLFLGAGSVMHAMGGIIDVRKFSGLRRILPWTCLTFVIGSLALAGFPMTSGFFSKDEIIHHALSSSPLLGAMAIITAALTAFYTFRMVFLAFAGPEKFPEGVHPHESGRWILLPLLILSVGAIGAGYLGVHVTGDWFHHFLAPVFASSWGEHPAHAAHAPEHLTFWGQYGLLVISGAISISAIALAYVFYVREPWIPGLVRASVGGLYGVLWNKWYVDELYDDAIVRPLRGLGRIAAGVDDFFIDGLIWIVTVVPRATAYVLRGLQSGILQDYAVTMVGGLAVILLLFFWK